MIPSAGLSRSNAAVAAVIVTAALVALAGCGGGPSPAPNFAEAPRGAEFSPVDAGDVEPCSSLPLGGQQAGAELLPDLDLSCLTSRRQINLRDLSGRPVLVNLWATWCGPCREEMPRLQAAYERFGDRVAFVGVDTQDYPDAAGEFLEEVGVTYPQLADPDGELLGFTRVPGLPVTLLLDADGVIVNRHIGGLDESDIEELIGEVG